MLVKVSDFISDFLASKGIEHVFTVTGGGAMHLNDSFGHHEKLKCIYNHHEQASAIAAEGYYRTALKPAVVCVTSGPGGTNALTGVMGAWVDSIPMMVISGQVKFETTIKSAPQLSLRQLGDQEFNIIDCVGCMTKYSVMIDEPNDILYHLEKAFFLMQEGRPAPVWLDIPLDIQAAKVDAEKLRHFNQDEIEQKKLDEFTSGDAKWLLEKIKKAKAPVVFAGTAIRNVGYTDKFIAFCERLNIPVVTAWNAHDSIYSDHPLFCGRPGTVGTRAGNFIVQNADLLLVIGSQLNIRQISYNYKSFAKKAELIVVDFDENELKKPTIKVDIPIKVDLRSFIDTCLELKSFEADNHKKWLQWARNIFSRFHIEHFESSGAMNPYIFVRALGNALKPNDTIVCSNGSAVVVPYQCIDLKKGQRMFTNSGCASMGYGLPAAIGSASAKNGGRVICFEGDGSLQMNVQELATVSYNKQNVKIIVINNNGYHSIRQTQINIFKGKPLCGVSNGNGLAFADLEKLAQAYGINYAKIDSVEQIEKILRLMDKEGPMIIEAVVDEKQFFAPKLSSKLLPDGKIVSPDIDEMYPFLPNDEYVKIKFED